MNFNSQVCTTRAQSERLLALGLKKETADMMYCETASGELVTAKDDDYLEHLDFPAWSLHRLIEIAGLTIKVKVKRQTVVVYKLSREIPKMEFEGNPYEAIIDIISWLINKNFLKEAYLENGSVKD